MRSMLFAGVAALSLLTVAMPASAQKQNYQTVDPSERATYGDFDLRSGFTPDPQSITITSGGPIDASNVMSGCRGTVARAPDIQINYSAGSLPLTFSTSANVDTTLLINDPSNSWSCDDDSGDGNNAMLTFNNPRSGVYDVWVGAYGGNSGSVELFVSELGRSGYSSNNNYNYNNRNNDNRNNAYNNNSSNGSSGRPDSSLNPTYGDVYLDAGFTSDPYRVSLSSGGAYDASGLGGQCRGMIASAPDFQLTYDAGSPPLIFSVNSNTDTTLVVNGPDGRWYCDDDGGSSGTNPAIRFNRPQSGTYDVWVGAYGGQGGSAELNISEVYSQ